MACPRTLLVAAVSAVVIATGCSSPAREADASRPIYAPTDPTVKPHVAWSDNALEALNDPSAAQQPTPKQDPSMALTAGTPPQELTQRTQSYIESVTPVIEQRESAAAKATVQAARVQKPVAKSTTIEQPAPQTDTKQTGTQQTGTAEQDIAINATPTQPATSNDAAPAERQPPTELTYQELTAPAQTNVAAADPKIDHGDAVAALATATTVQSIPPTIDANAEADSASANDEASLDEIEADYAARVQANPTDLNAQLDLQMVRILQGKPGTDPSLLSRLPEQDRRLVEALGDGLANLRQSAGTGEDVTAADRARPIVEMADRVRTDTDLNIPTVALCSAVRAFGNYDPIEPATFTAGKVNWMIFYCEVENFASLFNSKNLWESKLSLELKLFSENGMEVWNQPSDTVTDAARRKRTDFFINKKISLPATLGPGKYFLKATIRDQQANRIADQTVPISIVAG